MPQERQSIESLNKTLSSSSLFEIRQQWNRTGKSSLKSKRKKGNCDKDTAEIETTCTQAMYSIVHMQSLLEHNGQTHYLDEISIILTNAVESWTQALERQRSTTRKYQASVEITPQKITAERITPNIVRTLWFKRLCQCYGSCMTFTW